jgi:hypothetical protein
VNLLAEKAWLAKREEDMSFRIIGLLVGCSAAIFGGALHAAESSGGATLPPELTQSLDQNLPPSLADEVQSDLLYLSTMKGIQSSKLNSLVYGGSSLDGNAYLSFFLQRITGFKQDDCVACVDTNSSIMGIGGNYPNLSQIERISAMLHEARHTEVDHNGWKHVTCPPQFWTINGAVNPSGSDVFIQGTDACDDVPLGAYGIQIIFLKNVSEHCDTCTSQTKSGAQALADHLLERIISPAAFLELKED